VRFEIVGAVLKIYMTTAAHTDFLVMTRMFEEAELAAFGAATKSGFYIRTNGIVTRFLARIPDQRRDHITGVQKVAGTRTTHGALMREAAGIAVRERDAAITLQVLDPVADLGLPVLTGATDYFRGWINLPDGGGLLLARNSGYFVIRRPDGTMFYTTLGLTPTEHAELNMSGPCLAGPYIVCPPRDSEYVLLIDWRKLANEASLSTPGYATSKVTFGLDWVGADKFTGSIFVYDRYVVFFPTAEKRGFFIWDIITGDAYFESFGLNFATGGGSKRYIGGCQGFTGDIISFPFASPAGIVRLNLLTGKATQSDYDMDMTGTAKWSGATPAVDWGIWGAPRGATQGVLRFDEFEDRADYITTDKDGASIVDANTNRFITAPNFHLVGGSSGVSGKLMVVDPILRSITWSDFGTPIPSDAADQIGGISTGDGRIDMSPSSATKFLRVNFALSQPTPDHLLLDPAVNKGT
jgi:hypothetical protein